ncbi:trypsin-like peptidase domain-containing protein [Streptomyces sp. NPDC003781]|uniref:trypsin-like peptidase domain-containing protein n=1 Tax=Streptomyces sp. NPDC003781 TaxID=3364686 RepID=UPI00367A26BA
MASRNRSREATGGRAGERPGNGSRGVPGGPPAFGEADPAGHASAPDGWAYDAALIRFHDLAGRPRGTGFVADHHGTVLTSHEAVDGLPRLVLSTAGERRRVVAAADVTPLPALGLALVRTEGLGVDPLPLTARDRVPAGTYVRIAAGGWREARVLGATDVTYTATDRFHHLDDALELAVGTCGRDALRLGGGAAGGPVLDMATGAVLGVLGTALSSGHSDVGFAVPLRRATTGPLAELLAENAATVPAYGADLNLAGVLALTATTVTDGVPAAAPGGGSGAPVPVERAGVAREFAAFTAGRARVLGLVGAPGSGRTTELAALAARRSRGPEAAPTLWLRGADLHDGDLSLADAARRTLARTARIVAASGGPGPDDPGGLGGVTPERVAHLARTAGRPLLVLLDGPEEMPPVLAHRLPEWTEGTAVWLGETGTRLVVACRPEYWEHAGAEFPRELLYGSVPGEAPPPRAALAVPGPGAGASSSWTDLRPVRPEAAAGGAPTPWATGGTSGAPPWPRRTAAPAGPHPGAGVAGSLEATGGVGSGPASGGAAPWWRGGTGRVAPLPGPGTGAAGPLDATAAVASGPVPAGTPGGGDAGLPPCVRLGDLSDAEAREARARHGVPEGALAGPDAGHPLTLRLFSEVLAALAGPAAPAAVTRDAVFAAYLDLMCLRVATRLAGENGLHGAAVRRLAAKVSGQVHEAARRSLAPGQGGLDRESFGALFPWGPAPARLGGGTGWAPAVLAEGLFTPAGSGYRFAHEELADWIQGTHLDLEEALRALVHRRDTPQSAHTLPVPHHRIGSVVEAVLLLARQHGVPQLALTLEELVHALDRDPHSWWAARLLAEVLTRVPDATPYTEVLRLLADGIAERGGEGHPAPQALGPGFWTALRVPEATRLDLLRRLVLADGPPHQPGPRHLDTAAGLLAADPAAVQPLLVRWFDDERPLPATPHATVATAAQALLHTHRHRGLDGLTEVLVDSAHRRADELLAVLAEEEPSALCRAVERWARDERPARQTAAVTHGLRTAPHARPGADRTLLRHAALVLLAGPSDSPLRGGALALLVQDPACRDRHLPRALDHFAAGDPYLPPSAVAAALPTHPEPVLEAFRARLLGPDAGEALRRLADATTPALTDRVAALVGRTVAERPETAGHLAAYVDRRLDLDPAPGAVLLPLVTRLLDDGPEPARAALAGVLAADGATAGARLRRALREHLFAHEHDPAVLDALLHAAARCDGEELRALVQRTGRLLVRTPEGATRFDRGLVDLARHLPGFAPRLTGWLTDAPQDWAALVGPSTRRTIEHLAGARVPA